MVPTRMAMKVPASTSALPPTSSLWRRCCGISEYLSGPKMVASTPNRKITPSRIEIWPTYSATAPQHISTTSARRDWRISRLFSIFVRELAGQRGKQEERQDEQALRHVRQHAGIAGGRRAESDGHHHRVAEQVVVEGAEKLREKEWQEPASAQQRKLRAFGARNLFWQFHQALIARQCVDMRPHIYQNPAVGPVLKNATVGA